MTKASDNAFPSVLITEGTEPSAPAAGKQRLYIDSTSHKVMATTSSGVERLVESIPAGTSFPGSPATDDLFHRTDLDFICRYDGTRWLAPAAGPIYRPFGAYTSTQPFTTSPVTNAYLGMHHNEYDLWVEAFYVTTYVDATNSGNTGSHFWTLDCKKADVTLTTTSLVTQATSADTVANATTHKGTIGASVVKTTYKSIVIISTKTGTPGGLFIIDAMLAYRLIVT